MNPTNRRVGPPRRPPLATDGDESVTPAVGTAASSARAGAVLATMRACAGAALVGGASLAMAWGAHRYITTSPRFAVRTIEVTGEERRTADAVVAESGLTAGTNVFSADLDAARARLLADPWIADATLARRLPTAIVVRVVERRAAALLALGDTTLATADGEPFKKLEAGDPVDLPLVTGLTPERFASDPEGAKALVRRALDLAAEYQRGALARRAPLEEVHVDALGSLALVVGPNAVRIVLGAPPFRRKLDQAARVVAELDRRRVRAQSILLDNEIRPERVVVRLR